MQYEQVMAERRKQLGWSQEYLADLYGRAITGQPVSREVIAMMENKALPKDPKRRAILAALLGLPLSALGVETPKHQLKIPTLFGQVDLLEYKEAYHAYQKQVNGSGYDWRKLCAGALGRIQHLHNNVLYAGAEKGEMLELLCNFHLLVADVLNEQHHEEQAEEYFNKALIIARDQGLTHLEALALFRRGTHHAGIRDMNAAITDYQSALKIDGLPKSLKGSLLVSLGRTLGATARYPDDITAALRYSDLSEPFIGTRIDKTTYYLKFDRELWLLRRSNALISSPYKSCQFPEQALREVDAIGLPGTTRLSAYREIYSILVRAKAHFLQGEFPNATILAQSATGLMLEIRDFYHTRDVVELYTGLQGSSYGKSRQVLELGIEVMKVQHPDLFN